MSVYSTRTVTRDFAIRTLIGKIMSATNEELADLLFEAIGEETLNNFTVKDAQPNDDLLS